MRKISIKMSDIIMGVLPYVFLPWASSPLRFGHK